MKHGDDCWGLFWEWVEAAFIVFIALGLIGLGALGITLLLQQLGIGG